MSLLGEHEISSGNVTGVVANEDEASSDSFFSRASCVGGSESEKKLKKIGLAYAGGKYIREKNVLRKGRRSWQLSSNR